MLRIKNNFAAPYSFLFGFFILLFAQPDFSLFFSLLASWIGYGLLFSALILLTRKRRFLLATFSFSLIQLTHLSWLLRDAYVGKWIYLVVGIICIAIGLQMGVLSLFLKAPTKMNLLYSLAFASIWTLMEWSRLFFLSGFPFNPVGLVMSATDLGSQMAALIGIYGMSFLVILTNLFFYQKKNRPLLFSIALPFVWGFVSLKYHDYKNHQNPPEKLQTLLVQSGLLPEEKHWFRKEPPLAPQAIWEKLFTLMHPYFEKKIDLIVMSEGQLPYGLRQPIYKKEEIQESFQNFWNKSIQIEKQWVTNQEWSQEVANLFDADLIIGLDDVSQNQAFNAAFLFSPNMLPKRYEKRILLPMGEYIPFSFCKAIAKKHGITDSYARGIEAKVLKGKKADYGTIICMEENYGHITRETRKKNAQVLVGLSNDVWYPRSRLPYVHFLHAKLRAIECGIPLIRSCNTGVTCAIDSLGRVIKMACFASEKQAITAECILVEVPLERFFTLYSFLGDYTIISVSLLFMSLCCLRKKGEQQ